MRKLLITGNSGSGKSTLARRICLDENLPHLDLDTLAWQPTSPPLRKPLEESAAEINAFVDTHQSWVIEGCYTGLLEIAAPYSNELIFLDLTVDACVANARNRPWEPHKYKSQEAQDANLVMLVNWIKQYEERTGTFSRTAHTQFYEAYAGKKSRRVANESG